MPTKATGDTNISRCSIAIIGGGFTGTTLAAQTLRASGGSVSVVLIDRSPSVGRGVAYGTECAWHLLNVRAKNMSAFPDDPEHLLRWARLNYNPAVTPEDFLPRRVYGQYIASLLREETRLHPSQFKYLQDEATSLIPVDGSAQIHLRSGQTIVAEKVVLALGNLPPGDPHLPGRTAHSSRYVSNVWAANALGNFAKDFTNDKNGDKNVLLIGSGLTSVDVAIELRAREFNGTLHLLSRRGLLPQNHKPAPGWPAFWDKNSPRTVRGLVRLIRAQVRAAQAQGSDWRAVIDSLRPFTQEIWRALPRQERLRFLRHVRPYWEVHRHRIAPEIGGVLASQAQAGKMHTHAGRITEYHEDADGVDVTFRDRKSGKLETVRVDRVINCTGPEVDCRRSGHALLANLMHQKMARPDPLSLGLDVSPEGALIDAHGVASDILYTVGPSRRGSLWETTAVPEIRGQVLELATLLVRSAQEIAEPQIPEPVLAAQLASRQASPLAMNLGGGAMYFEQFYLGCLAHASYMLASHGEAVVVDPQRDVDIYLKAADEQGVKIRHIFETHLHADFVSGHKELAARTGAKIYMGPVGEAPRSHLQVDEGFELRVGAMRIRVLETPGHTPESICLVVTDEEKSSKPWAVLTGDTLFIGDVGRPDLSKTHTPAMLAGLLYQSLHNRLLKLPDEVLVYPAHGAGSLCGRNMRAERSSTIGTERLTNYALQIKTKKEFVRQLTSNLPTRPEYFPQDAQLNLSGAPALSDLPDLTPISAPELKSLLHEGVIALDVRSGVEFASGHVPAAINIPLAGEFASWAGAILGLSARPVLIAATKEQLAEARMRLARVGIDDVRGYLQDGFEGWMQAGFDSATLPQITAQDLNEQLESRNLHVVDVRRNTEWQAGHIHCASWRPLDALKSSLSEMDRKQPFAVHCKGGYRSLIACSLLRRAGFQNVTNVIGGFDAWKQANLPFVSEEVIAV
jgi:uncharacterized NAD(P)/FAD-binding protein YdhS/glyoxylase-like metal-dependent hydrolase (beta-lactamase superfamily II)/rhodanese-related sulfurtransferase